MQKISSGKLKIFKIENRRGYACICLNNLTEGKTPAEAYARMGKAQKRKGRQVCEFDRKLITSV
jgi:hypothetical protein